jgi:hypothetical protein
MKNPIEGFNLIKNISRPPAAVAPILSACAPRFGGKSLKINDLYAGWLDSAAACC